MAFTTIDSSLVPSAAASIQNLPNILINGGFEFWQRNTSFSSPANDSYVADRWRTISDGTPTFTVAREAGAANIDSVGTYSFKLDVTAVGGSTILFFVQFLENFADYRGKTISFSIRVKASAANSVCLRVSDAGGSNTYSARNTGTGFETLTVTHTVNALASGINIGFGFFSAGGAPTAVRTCYFDSAMLVVGSTPSIFVGKDYQTELAQCQRYCSLLAKIDGNTHIGAGMNISGTDSYVYCPLPVQMRVDPTVTIFTQTDFRLWSSAGGTINATAVAVLGTYTSPTSILLQVTVASGLSTGNSTLLRGTTAGYVLLEAEL